MCTTSTATVTGSPATETGPPLPRLDTLVLSEGRDASGTGATASEGVRNDG